MTVAELTAKISVIGEAAAVRAMRNVGNAARGVGEAIRTAADATRLLDAAQASFATVTGVQAAMAYDSQVRGLAAYAKNAQELQDQLGRLQEIAKLPGLGIKEVRAGVLQLEAAGLNAQTAERALMAFGNALALVGKGKSELDGVILALGQIASKGSISAEEINQIAERVPQIRQVLVSAFGTASTEAIQKMGLSADVAIGKIIAGLERLPTATGGALNSFENLADALDRAFIPIGRGLLDIFQSFAPAGENALSFIGTLSEQIGQMLSAIGKSGIVVDVVRNLFGLLGGGQGGFAEQFATVASNIFAFFDQLPNIIRNAMQLATQYLLTPLAHIAATVGNMLEILPFVGKNFKSFASDARGYADQLSAKKYGPLKPVDIASKAQEFRQRIMSNVAPQGLPSGLTFGGMQQPVGSESPVTSLLGRIADNTKTTAEALTLRRETLGGGRLGQLGVTAAEMAGSTGPIRMGDFMGGGNRGLIPAGTELERAVRSVIRDEARRNGTPGIMKRF